MKVGYRYMTHIFRCEVDFTHETNGARQNRLDGRQKWLEPTWNVQVDLKSTPRSGGWLHTKMAYKSAVRSPIQVLTGHSLTLLMWPTTLPTTPSPLHHTIVDVAVVTKYSDSYHHHQNHAFAFVTCHSLLQHLQHFSCTVNTNTQLL